MKRYGNKRDVSEPEIVKTLRQAGCTVFLTDKPFDLVIGYRGRTYLGECKDPKKEGWKNEFTKAQLEFMEEWRGEPVAVFRTPLDVINWINKVGNK